MLLLTRTVRAPASRAARSAPATQGVRPLADSPTALALPFPARDLRAPHLTPAESDGSMLLFSIVRSRPVAYSPNRRMRVLGCMSGTSVDGIDVACADLELAGDELACRYLGLASTPFDARLRERIVAAMPPGLPGASELCQLHAELGYAYAA